MDHHPEEEYHLVKICQVLVAEFDSSELLHACTRIGMDARGLLGEGPLTIEATISLVNHFHKQERMPDLLKVCNRQRKGVFDEMLFALPSVEWTPKKLPQPIITVVNELLGTVLGTVGQPYRIFDEEWIETGCIHWLIDVDAMDFFAPVPEIDKVLARVRKVLKGETVIAYKGDLTWGGRTSSSQIVVAPTTDQFDILRIERTEAVNSVMDTAEVIYELQQIDKQFGIDIAGASGGVIEFLLKRIPEGEEIEQFHRWLLWLGLGHDVLPEGDTLPPDYLTGPIGLFRD